MGKWSVFLPLIRGFSIFVFFIVIVISFFSSGISCRAPFFFLFEWGFCVLLFFLTLGSVMFVVLVVLSFFSFCLAVFEKKNHFEFDF